MSKTPSNTNTASCAWRLGIFAAAMVLPLLVTSCGKKVRRAKRNRSEK